MKIPEYGKIYLVFWDTYRPDLGWPPHSSPLSINRDPRPPAPTGRRPHGDRRPPAHPHHPAPAPPAAGQPGHHRPGHDHPKITPPHPGRPLHAASCGSTRRDNHGGTLHVLQDQTCVLIICEPYTRARPRLSAQGGEGGVWQHPPAPAIARRGLTALARNFTARHEKPGGCPRMAGAGVRARASRRGRGSLFTRTFSGWNAAGWVRLGRRTITVS